jgi:adenylyltransferase/sulfurtransferase
MTLNEQELKRYSRHLLLKEIGLKGQEQLKNASVLIIGMGGLGNPAAMYLAASGVGQLGIVDFDRVEESNLQRQVLFGYSDLRKSKVEVAAKKLKEINPTIKINLYEERLTASNALAIIQKYDVIADGSDNFQTRYLVNDACVLLDKPNVYAAIQEFQGQATVFWSTQGPCYRCLFPVPPTQGSVPNCAEAGVMGVLPGILGTIQATEVIKLILNMGELLLGRLLAYDALSMSFSEIALQKNPQCPVCGQQATIKELIDYEAFCGIEAVTELADVNQITPDQLAQKLKADDDVFVLDVREEYEREVCRINESVHIPMAFIKEKLNLIPSSKEVVVVCHMGVRSTEVVRYLKQNGFDSVFNLTGGIDQWAKDVEPEMKRY